MYASLVLALAIAVAVAALTIPGLAEEKEKDGLKVGEKAPDFAWPNAEEKGKEIHLSDLRGKQNVLIAFYPKAFTPGCTKQLCGYRDDVAKFQSADTEIVAVSIDNQAESDRFREEHKMPFVVLGDPEHKVIDAYDVPVRDYQGIAIAQRAVVLVDKDGVVQYVDMDYKIGEDEEALFKAIDALSAKDKEKEAGKA